ncbi:MAG: hypothetical protein IID46_05080 [Planctomycetes bacterium]|nr:hypothetical protein [Planctomycetota bacterium]
MKRTRRINPVSIILAAVLILVFNKAESTAENFAEGFDTTTPSCRIHYDTTRLKLISHQRHTVRHSGRSSERVLFEAFRPGRIQLEQTLPGARVIDDLKLSLWVRSNQPGAVLFLRLVFPHQTDPRPGKTKTLKTYLRGDQYTKTGHWQKLECTAQEDQVRRQIEQLRAQLNDPLIDTRDLYIDQMVLTAPVRRGVAELFVDELQFGPVITLRSQAVLETVSNEESQPSFPVEFELDRLLVHGRPFFLRLAAYHNERIDVLKETGINLVWVPNYQDRELLSGLKRRGLWVTATPPRADTKTKGDRNAPRASLIPFTDETSPILSWILGTRIPPTAREEFVGVMQQVRNADRRFKRPVMADFTGLEHVYSRHDLMMGVSRHMLHTSFSFRDYRDWLIQKRDLAQPGTFLWTWIQTEPAAIHSEQREAAGRTPAVVEPEQIRLQVYAALSAGYRGVGFWKRTALDSQAEGAVERRLAMTQLNLELELLAPLLATGTVVAQIPFSVPSRETPRFGRRVLDFRNTQNEIEERSAILQENRNQRKGKIDGELQAALIKSDWGKLLLPVWYETDAQFVPGQMAAKNVSIVVLGVGESSSVWLVTTTGIHSLQREQVTGGIRITIPLLDQTAAVLFTSDPAVIQSLRRKIHGMAMKSARVSIDLAAAKLERVRRVDEELQQVHTGQPDAPQLLAGAGNLIKNAEDAFKRGHYHAARERAAESMQSLRILQRAHWNVAVLGLSSPVSSLHTVSFQTLPDHWRMVSRLGRSPMKLDANLLRSGDCEDMQTMVVEGWGHSQNQVEGIRAMAELYPGGFKGSYSLRLIAVPETGQDRLPSVIVNTPVTVTTPPVLVHSGQILHVSGWIRVVSPVVGHLDGVMLYDNIGGPIGALRWRNRNTTWQRFEIVRDVEQSGPYQLTVSLNGMGEIQLDELKIIPHSPQSVPVAGEDSKSQEDKSAGSRTLDFLNRFSGLRPPSFGKN